ncbi:MAG: aldose 1-epimerase family protein [Oscillospiraceae bacterium]|nr:aldose 1-epimerase family protein [Oscillospiraceae bacterium]
MQYTLKKKELEAVIETHGAELVSLKKNGTETIWSGEAWNRHAPVLFPFVCNTRSKKFTVEGKEYSFSNHGFARDTEFDVCSNAEDSITLFISSEREDIKDKFPFDYKFFVTYSLDDEGLTFEFRVENTGFRRMYFFVGGHPGFFVPFRDEKELSFEDHTIVYEKDEHIVQHLDSGDVTVLEKGNSVKVTRELFKNDVFLIDRPASSKVSIVSKSGRRITLSYDNRGVIAVWSPYKEDAEFICLEPWAQTPVYDGGSEELTEMKNAMHLEAGQLFTMDCKIDLSSF